jgi:hypothetical protein
VDHLVDAAAGLPAEAGLVQGAGDGQRAGGGALVAADELLVDQVDRARDLRVAAEHLVHLGQHPPQRVRMGAGPLALVGAGTERAEVGTAPRRLKLRDAVMLEDRLQQIKLRQDVGLLAVADSRGVAEGPWRPGGDGERAGPGAGPVGGAGVADPADLGTPEVAVPVSKQISDGGLAGAAGDQQAGVAVQQQPLVASDQAAAGHQQRRRGQRGHGVQEAYQEVVLAEGRRDPQDVGPLARHGGDDVVQGHAKLHVEQADLAEQGGTGRAGEVADGKREAGQREVLGVVERHQRHPWLGQPVDSLLVEGGSRQPRLRAVDPDVPACPGRPGAGAVGPARQVRHDPAASVVVGCVPAFEQDEVAVQRPGDQGGARVAMGAELVEQGGLEGGGLGQGQRADGGVDCRWQGGGGKPSCGDEPVVRRRPGRPSRGRGRDRGREAAVHGSSPGGDADTTGTEHENAGLSAGGRIAKARTCGSVVSGCRGRRGRGLGRGRWLRPWRRGR